MKRRVGMTALLMAALLCCMAGFASASARPSALFRSSEQPFTGQADVTDADMEVLDAWAEPYAETDFTALFVASFEESAPSRGDANHHGVTGPFFTAMNRETGEILNTAQGEDPADLLARDMLYLEPVALKVRGIDTGLAFYSAERFLQMAREDAPPVFGVYYHSRYRELGEYSPAGTAAHKRSYNTMDGRFHFVNAATGALDSRQSHGVYSSPKTLKSWYTDAYGERVARVEDPWEKLVSSFYFGDDWVVSAAGELTDYRGLGRTELEIPEHATGIAKSAMAYLPGVTRVTVPGGVKTIGERAFADSRALETVVLGEGVTRIEAGAFENCPALREVVLPQTLEYIGDKAFSGCEALESIRLPESLTGAGWNVFKQCTSLSELRIPSQFGGSSDMIGFGNSGLETLIVANDGWKVTTNLTGLKTLIFEEGVTAINLGFVGATMQAEHIDVYLPASVTEYEESQSKHWKALGRERKEQYTLHVVEDSRSHKLARRNGADYVIVEE